MRTVSQGLSLVVAAIIAIIMAGGLTPAAAAPTETIAIIGTGRVGGALGPQFAKLGDRVIYGSRDPAAERVSALVARTGGSASAATPARAAAAADIIVLAVPWKAAEGLLKGLGDLSGKIILDATNPLSFGTNRLPEISVDTSGGELIQGWAPSAKVVKAFNAIGSAVMADPVSAGGPVTIPLAGDDAAAKARIAQLIQRMGFETADVGPIRHARYLEGMAVLYLTPVMSGRPGDGFEYYLRKRPAAPATPIRPPGS